MNTIDLKNSRHINQAIIFDKKISFGVQGQNEEEKECRLEEIIKMIKNANLRYLFRSPLPSPSFLDAVDFTYTVSTYTEAENFLIVLGKNNAIDKETMEFFGKQVKIIYDKRLQAKF